jgi:hypothetical protein
VTFTDASSPTTTASFGEAGEYVLRITADDGELQASDDVTVTVLPVDTPQTVSVRIATGADDASEGGGSSGRFVSLTGNDLELGTDVTSTATFSTLVGLRYQLDIPAGAIIDSATVRFTVDEVSTGTADLNIQVEAADDAAPFRTGAGNLSGRARTTASVPWTPTAWTTVNASGPDQTTPDIASVLQRVIDRPGWAEGNHAALLISGTGRRTADSHEGGSAKAATLDITWHLPEADTNRAPIVSAGPAQEIQLPAAANLSGTVADDGLPATPGAVTSTWTKVSGPGEVTFTDASSPTTTASFGEAGEYVLRLTADDGELQASGDVTVTVLPVDTPQTVSLRIAAGADDASEGGGSSGRFVSITGNDLELGTDVTSTATYSTLVGLRYQLNIPAGAIIDSATVRFTVDEVSIDTADLNIQVEAADDAAPFQTGAGNLSDRARTTASVPWTPTAWTTVNASGPDQTTPDIASVLQRVIDRPGWADGNHAALLISGTGRRTADSYEGGSTKAATLDITWHLPE